MSISKEQAIEAIKTLNAYIKQRPFFIEVSDEELFRHVTGVDINSEVLND